MISTAEKYPDKSDEELIVLLRQGDRDIMDLLLDKYKNLVRKKVHALYLQGGDFDDLMQEGMIGLFRAISDYDPGQGGFFPFAQLCITRQLYTAVKNASRKKHIPLNNYTSLSAGDADPDDGDQNGNSIDDRYLVSREYNPEDIVLEQEGLEDLMAGIQARLSAMETTVLDYYLGGLTYRQIAEIMKLSPKSVDNALQRIRGKVQELRK